MPVAASTSTRGAGTVMRPRSPFTASATTVLRRSSRFSDEAVLCRRRPARIRPGGFTTFGAGLTYEEFKHESGTGATPSIEEIFTPETAPGLGSSPAYFHTVASGGIDSRPSPGYARRGGLYELAYHNYADRDETYSFDRSTPRSCSTSRILRENWVISLHGRVQSTLSDDDVVPLLPAASARQRQQLRGYSSWRFRDRHSLLMSGEWRWIPSRLAMDMALFYDAGKVTPRFDDISFKDLKTDFGIGVRFHTPFATPLRVELAKSREGTRIVFSGGAAF